MRKLIVFVWASLMRACPETLDFTYPDGETYVFSVSSFQMKVESFVNSDDRPPFKESHFISKLPPDEVLKLIMVCPQVWVFSRLIAFETFAFSRGVHESKVEYIESLTPVLGSLTDQQRLDLKLAWPYDGAVARVERTVGELSQLQQTPKNATVSFIVCHCREPLDWLGHKNLTHVPPRSSLYVYEKCRENSAHTLQGHGVVDRFDMGVFVVDRPDGAVRGDECSGFLSHIVENYDSLADFTILMQSDPDHHLFFSYFDLVLRGITLGSYNLPFLHLNYHRHVQTSTPCMRDVERFLFGFPDTEVVQTKGLLGTYCCSQFVVRKDRILGHSKEFYNHMLAMVDGRYPDLCVNGQPKRSSQCYVFEFLWHVVFGEPRDLPLRPDDHRLPLALRMKYGNEHVRNWWADLDLAPGTLRPLKSSIYQ